MSVSSILLAMAVATSAVGQANPINTEEVEYQSENFSRWWGTEFEWRFHELPDEGGVSEDRIPYSGHDYPDRAGGTTDAMRKYDAAFHNGRTLATSWERSDVGADRQTGRSWVRGRGLFRNLFAPVSRGPDVPGWYGHCNGWTAAAIRHAEPQYNVVRNGVQFTPADIKGLLAEIYMYCDAEFLGGVDRAINPGLFHAVISNWMGRGKHPVGMETTLGPEKWNYPAYAFSTSSAQRSDNRVEVKLNLAYSMSTRQEFSRTNHIKRVKYFHYELELDEDGRIVGGVYFRDSDRIDMLWTPLKPAPGGEEGNLRGNPHVDIDTVLALWRDSVPAEAREKWLNIDPTDADRVIFEEAQSASDEPSDVPNDQAADATATADEASDDSDAAAEGANDAGDADGEAPEVTGAAEVAET